MRVTDNLRTRTVIDNLNMSRDRLTKLQENLADGKRIHRPSDDPLGASNSLKLKTVLEANEQFNNNIDDSIAYFNSAESALDNLNDMMIQVKEIITRGASDQAADRKYLAHQLEMLLTSMLDVGNTKSKGKYIFGGTETINAPFTLNTNELKYDLGEKIVTYRGNTDNYKRQINENTLIPLNVTGTEVFQRSDIDGVDLFQMVKDVIDLFEKERDPDETVRGQDISPYIDEIDKGIEQVLEVYLKIGTRKQLALFNRERFQAQDIQMRNDLSQLEDTDFGTTFIQFKAEENALNSALSAGARVISPSLLDFLGI